jgi:uncharacterized protein (TIGR03067 family)
MSRRTVLVLPLLSIAVLGVGCGGDKEAEQARLDDTAAKARAERAADKATVESIRNRANAAGARAELKKLEGAWVVVQVFAGGKEVDRGKGSRLVFQDATLKDNLDGKERSAEIKIDPRQPVKEIDATEGGKTVQGVYDLHGDDLEICWGRTDRPGKLSKDELLYVLKREKK